LRDAVHAGNGVAAIGSYWLTTVQAIMDFETKHPEACHRIRYEDLVTAPEETAAAMFSFLAAEPAPGIVQAAFRVPHESNGPSDEKIWFTDDVTDASIGRGYRVPAGDDEPAASFHRPSGHLAGVAEPRIEYDHRDHRRPGPEREQARHTSHPIR